MRPDWRLVHHFLTDDSLLPADKDQQESCAVAGKPHDAVVKFDQPIRIDIYSAYSAVLPARARLSCYYCLNNYYHSAISETDPQRVPVKCLISKEACAEPQCKFVWELRPRIGPML